MCGRIEEGDSGECGDHAPSFILVHRSASPVLYCLTRVTCIRR